MTRRGLLIGTGAAASTLLLPGGRLLAQPAAHRIDVHHHITPPAFLAAMEEMGTANPPMAGWSVQQSLEDMDQGGVATSIVSPSTPQLKNLSAEQGATVSRESNEYAVRLRTDHPGRFGAFAMLPLPHIDACLREIEYAFDTLKMDGVGCLTSYGDKWLGYAEFEPVWAELDRRGATVYTHPTNANCCVNVVRDLNDAFIEYGTDTARTIFTLIFSGFGEKYPNINWIFSHGGGSVPSFYERFVEQSIERPPYAGQFTREQIETQLRRFYYDTAAVSNAVTLAGTREMAGIGQIVYGTDYPYRSSIETNEGLATVFTGEDLQAVERGNALRLFPGFG
ncbi:amidohydrolase family protein [Paracoccus sp. S1E-3]|uniref:amidohydrolase family protein n=1 Tax=Paracoccus sp. S1E-3 TaxID=2756130 RepID=UPI0015EED119|nr:amidohydrolase family protein [Paracoccus sp. S1E-3]MBA4489834.1 amidohydrolase [Paracoccus sp. S1E-3]